MMRWWVLLLLLNIFNLIHLNRTETNCSYGSVLIGDTCEECGTTDDTPNVKIVNGIPAVPNSWPAQVYILQIYKTIVDLGPDGNHTVEHASQCGGTLISSDVVLTAAHCVNFQFNKKINGTEYTVPITTNSFYPTYESMFLVFLGAHNVSFISDDSDIPAGVVVARVREIVGHDFYNTTNYLNDIALFKLTSNITTTTSIKYACLPQKQSNTIPTPNQDCYLSGWGHTQYGGMSSDVLLNIKLNIYNSSLCSNVLTNFEKDWDSQICAGDLVGFKDSCQGDSGGGLYTYDSAIQRYVVVGVVSYGDGCGSPGKPGIYTRVSNYMEWIKLNTATSSASTTSSVPSTTTNSSVSSTTSTSSVPSTTTNSSASSSISTSSVSSTITSSTTVNSTTTSKSNGQVSLKCGETLLSMFMAFFLIYLSI